VHVYDDAACSGTPTRHASFAAAHTAAAQDGDALLFAALAPLSPAAERPELVAALEASRRSSAEIRARAERARAAFHARFLTCGACGGQLRPHIVVHPVGVPVVPDFECSKCGCCGPRHEIARIHRRERHAGAAGAEPEVLPVLPDEEFVSGEPEPE
jgi:hypothetical protein